MLESKFPLDDIDVVVLTKNSAITLEACLRGIFNSIPVNKLIVVDGGSSDATLKIARKYGARIIYEKKNLARSRYRGVLEAKTEWFCFVDSDIALHSLWYERLKKWMKYPRVVWVKGLTGEHSKILPSYALSKILRSKAHNCGVGLTNSLLKRDIVLKCADWLREDIRAGEDSVLHNFLKSKGYRDIGDTTFVACSHIPDSFLHDIYALFRIGQSVRLKHKRIRTRNLLGYPIYLLRNAFIGFKDTFDPRLFAYYFAIQGASYLLGYLGIGGIRISHFMKKIDALSKTIGAGAYHFDLSF